MDHLNKPDDTAQRLMYSAQVFSKMGTEATSRYWDQSQSVAKVLLDANADAITFMTQQITRSNEMLGHATQCRSLPEFLDAESQWLRAVFDDYSEYGRRLADLNRKLFACVSRAPRDEEPMPPQPSVPSKPKQVSQPALQTG